MMTTAKITTMIPTVKSSPSMGHLSGEILSMAADEGLSSVQRGGLTNVQLTERWSEPVTW
jgi:hypothetical protein